MGDLCEEYIERHAKVKKKSWKEDQRILEKDIIPIWNRRKASDVKRKDVIHLLDNIVERGAEIQANRTLAVIRRMFSFAIERDILEFSPCNAVKAPAKENIKDRVLSDEEIKALWSQLDECKSMDRRIALSLKLMLITGQRKIECLHLKYSEIDNSGWWTIPKEISKNGKPHRVFLSPKANEVITLAKQLLPESDWVFPSPRTGKPFIGSSIDHALRDIKAQEIIKVDFTPHDLRRTASSMMTSMGIPRLTVSKILNHSEAGVTAKHYDHYAYDNEKKDAMHAWDRKLNQILVDPNKVKSKQILAKPNDASLQIFIESETDGHLMIKMNEFLLRPFDNDEYAAASEFTDVATDRGGRTLKLNLIYRFGQLQEEKRKSRHMDRGDGGSMDMGY